VHFATNIMRAPETNMLHSLVRRGGALQNVYMHRRKEGVAFGTLIMRSSWGLALYTILTPRIQKHFFLRFHRPSKADTTCIAQYLTGTL
jgi:hypothetical protein